MNSNTKGNNSKFMRLTTEMALAIFNLKLQKNAEQMMFLLGTLYKEGSVFPLEERPWQGLGFNRDAFYRARRALLKAKVLFQEGDRYTYRIPTVANDAITHLRGEVADFATAENQWQNLQLDSGRICNNPVADFATDSTQLLAEQASQELQILQQSSGRICNSAVADFATEGGEVAEIATTVAEFATPVADLATDQWQNLQQPVAEIATPVAKSATNDPRNACPAVVSAVPQINTDLKTDQEKNTNPTTPPIIPPPSPERGGGVGGRGIFDRIPPDCTPEEFGIKPALPPTLPPRPIAVEAPLTTPPVKPAAPSVPDNPRSEQNFPPAAGVIFSLSLPRLVDAATIANQSF